MINLSKFFFSLVFLIIISSAGFSESLSLNGQSNQTFEGKTYESVSIENCTNIKVKNCTISNSNNIEGNHLVHIINSQQITIEGCDLNGLIHACSGATVIGGKGVTFRNNKIHDIADDGIQCHGVEDLVIEGNTISKLYSCGTDGNCGPCYNGHSDGIEFFSINKAVIRKNLIYDGKDGKCNAALFFGGDPITTKDVLIENNIFYTPTAGIVAYVQYAQRPKIFNNIIWGGSWQGLSIGKEVTDMEVKNNIIQSINYTHMGATFDPAEHDIDYNLLANNSTGYGYTLNTHDIADITHRFVKIPEITSSIIYDEVKAEDFAPISSNKTIDAGLSGSDIPILDYYGYARLDSPVKADTGGGSFTYYDIGAIEYGGQPSQPPTTATGESVFINVRIYPNPFKVDDAFGGNLKIDMLPIGTILKIYNSSGDLIRTLKEGESDPGMVIWDGRNEKGENAVSGTYFINLEATNGEKKIKKVTIMR